MASFDVAQKDGYILIAAIRKYLSFTTAIYLDHTNCSKLKVTGGKICRKQYKVST